MQDRDYPLLSLKECADHLNVSTDTVYILIKRQQLRARKLGNLWRIRPQDLGAAKKRCVHYNKSTHEWIALNANQ
jgi:excisionase family DNA binding protein